MFSFAFRNLFFFIVYCSALFSTSHVQRIKVTPSILPIALILDHLIEGMASEISILPPLIAANASVHDAPLSIADYKICHESTLIFWIGPQLEQSTAPLFQRFPQKAVALGELPSLRYWLESTESVHACCHQHHQRHAKIKDLQRDWHVWYSPEGVKILATEMSLKLAELLPDCALLLKKNLDQFLDHLAALIDETQHFFASQAIHSFGVTHNAYRHLLTSMGLPPAQEFLALEQASLSPSHFLNILERLKKDRLQIFLVEWRPCPMLEKLQSHVPLHIVKTEQQIFSKPERPHNYLHWLRELIDILKDELVIGDADSNEGGGKIGSYPFD